MGNGPLDSFDAWGHDGGAAAASAVGVAYCVQNAGGVTIMNTLTYATYIARGVSLGAIVGTVTYTIGDAGFEYLGVHDAIAEAMARSYVSVEAYVCESRGHGERGIQGKDPNPWKGYRPRDPGNPSKGGEKRDPQTGKWYPVPRPTGPPPPKHPDW